MSSTSLSDPVVRVDARRLRDKLREYYEMVRFDSDLMRLDNFR